MLPTRDDGANERDCADAAELRLGANCGYAVEAIRLGVGLLKTGIEARREVERDSERCISVERL